MHTDQLPVKGEIWRHTKTGGTYRIEGTALNTVTDKLDVVYAPMFQADFQRFTRQMFGHPKAFVSRNEDGAPRFVRVKDDDKPMAGGWL